MMAEREGRGIGGGFDVTKTVVIAASCALAYLAVVVGVTAYCSVVVLRKRRQRKQGDGTDSGGLRILL